MSIYDQRERPAYEYFRTEPNHAANPDILRWWTHDHDSLLKSLIARFQWVWYWSAPDEIVATTDPAVLDAWRTSDPRCRGHAWYNILMYFAASRAEQLGLTLGVRKPEARSCLFCSQRFVEDSLPLPLVQRLGIDRLEFCAPCLRDTVLQGTGDDSMPSKATRAYLRELAELIGRVPPQAFGEGMDYLHDLRTNERLALLQLLRRKPTVKRVKQLFGSWLNALIQADVLEDGTRRTSRGVQTIARDGHVCLSLGERTICDFLHARGIPHEKEPRYPDSNFRGDFRVGEVVVEYLGLAGDPDYDAKTQQKRQLCTAHGLRFLAVYPKDLASRTLLAKKLSVLK